MEAKWGLNGGIHEVTGYLHPASTHAPPAPSHSALSPWLDHARLVRRGAVGLTRPRRLLSPRRSRGLHWFLLMSLFESALTSVKSAFKQR